MAAAAGLSMAGFIHWIHASFRYSVQGVDTSLIAGAYAVAMLVDAWPQSHWESPTIRSHAV